MTDADPSRLPRWMRVIGPGILVAATGVGTGDLATGALVGSKLGVAVLWGVVLGAALKFVLTEGLARWQLATGTTVLEGVVRHFGRFAQTVFFAYLLLWTYFTAVALMGACGVAGHAILPLGDAQTDKVTYGIAHSLLAVLLVELGGFRLFERVMSACIGLMFVTVLVTAVAVGPAWGEILRGLVWPTIPDFRGEGLNWTVALIGGVGGTLTVLCYGYWIREAGRHSVENIPDCRLDLAAGYTMTAFFGIGMVVIGSRIALEKKPPELLLIALADELEHGLGPAARWVFLTGAWAAIFSSVLGVWQSVPYLFADFLSISGTRSPDAARAAIDTRGLAYRGYLYAMATLPALGLFRNFAAAQKAYAVFGALFIPLLAVALLLLNGSPRRIGPKHGNGPLATIALFLAVILFVIYGYFTLRPMFAM